MPHSSTERPTPATDRDSRRRAPAAVSRLVQVGSHALAVTERGAPRPGIPAVVVLAGAGDCQASWAPVATA